MVASAQPPPEVASLLEAYELQGRLDESALSLLSRVDPARAAEVIEDVASRGDVRNPSAFVARALRSYPQPRGGEAPPGIAAVAAPRPALAAPARPAGAAARAVDAALQLYPELQTALDERALRQLRGADPERAAEVVEELAAKADVQNPSAFVMKSLASHPHKRGQKGDVEGLLAQHPAVEAALDEAALSKLKAAEPARAVEIVEDVLAKGDLQNTSAFVVKALTSYPHKRGPLKNVVQVLARHPEVRDALDEAASAKLGEADPARAVEIIEDIAARGDVRNPSAFVAKALQLYPHKRGGPSEAPPALRPMPMPTPAAMVAALTAGAAAASAALRSGGPLERELARQPAVMRGLDADAVRTLSQADPDRAIEIVRDLAAKVMEVRNPSAFAMQALKAFPTRRGDPQDVDSALARRPRVRAALDEAALQRLRDADPARAVEVIEDVAAKTDVHNPSAFVVKALAAHPLKRGQEDQGGAWVDAPAAKQPRPGAFGFQRSATQSSPAATLDDKAQRSLDAANPARAAEILEELEEKRGQVRNASAFVARALQQYPNPRGRKAT